MKNKKYSGLIMIASILLAIVCGLLLPKLVNSLSFIGAIYLNVLKLMVVPLIFTTVMVSVYNFKKLDSKKLFKTILVFVLMFTVSFLITSGIVCLIRPGENFIFDTVSWNGEVANLEFGQILTNMFPSNLSDLFQTKSMFACLIISFLFGSLCLKVKNGDAVIKVVDGLKEILYKLLDIVMLFTPLAVFSLLGSAIANYKVIILEYGLKYIGVAYLSSLVVLILVMILPAWLLGKVNPIEYIKKIVKVWVISLSTCSSAATLPTTMKVCKEDFKISDNVTDMVCPLGSTINMCGGAVAFALLGIFSMELYGIEMTLPMYLLMLVSATLINMGAPGIPGGGIVIGATYLSMFNIPLAFIGFYSGIYKILDMVYTTVNVTGDVTASIIIDN